MRRSKIMRHEALQNLQHVEPRQIGLAQHAFEIGWQPRLQAVANERRRHQVPENQRLA